MVEKIIINRQISIFGEKKHGFNLNMECQYTTVLAIDRIDIRHKQYLALAIIKMA